MKKHNKCALGLVAATLSIVALGGCSKVYVSNSGAVVTYTDASGNRVSYTAEELFGSYRDSSSSLTTEFDKVYEVLIRKYYDTLGGSKLEDCKTEASQDVTADRQTARKNAEDNGTTYEEEWESILDSHSVDNIDELYEYYLYQAESEDFSNELNLTFGTRDNSVNGYEAMRDGEYTVTVDGVETTKEAFPESKDWGRGNEGYIKEEMPYHVRHILVKNASGADKEYTQDTLTATEANKVANVIVGLAGAQLSGSGSSKTLTNATNRLSFGILAQVNSEDTSSGRTFGEGDIMTKESSLINEYKLGIYAYESLYNEREKATEYGAANVHRITPGLAQDATSTADIDETLTVSDTRFGEVANDYEVTVNEFFAEEGIGSIPFGAALALSDYSEVDTDINGNMVNDANEHFYPRNVLWNKYFNKHQVCVITPNAIEANTTNSTYGVGAWARDDTPTAAAAATNTYIDGQNIQENWEGVYSSQFGSLPGFSVDTTNILPEFEHNVLTDSEGQVVLAVRGGSGTSYQGIFFIVVQRSALSQYGIVTSGNQYVAATDSAKGEDGNYTEDRADLNDYYNVYVPSETGYPSVVSGSTTSKLSTLINYNRSSDDDLNDERDSLVSAISSYNDDINTYNFQRLYEDDGLVFCDDNLRDALMNYSETKRQSTATTAFETWSDAWKEYAESIATQEAARDEDNTLRTGELITERAVINYQNPNRTSESDGDIWNVGGACYYDA